MYSHLLQAPLFPIKATKFMVNYSLTLKNNKLQFLGPVQPPIVCINEGYWDIATPTHLHSVHGCPKSSVVVTKLNKCYSDCVAYIP